MHMIILLLMMWMGSVHTQASCNDKKQECSLVNSNLTKIPTNLTNDMTKLNLAQNKISSETLLKESLKLYPNLQELDLSSNIITNLSNSIFSELTKLEVLILKDNNISVVEELSFQGLESLRILDLSDNQIMELPTNILQPVKKLQELNLQNNIMTNLDIKDTVKDLKAPLNITLSGNPWNCSCSLMHLSECLNTSTVILENENITTCATPEHMINYTIQAILTAPEMQECKEKFVPSSPTAATYPSNAPIPTVSNGTVINGTAAASTKGNSWRFLIGVVIVGIFTLLLILAAVKFPRWYDWLLSYNHHRLKEEEPYMFEEEFNVDFSMSPNDKIQEEDETVVVFEQMHSFVPEEDGFIEDKYIDEKDMRAES